MYSIWARFTRAWLFQADFIDIKQPITGEKPLRDLTAHSQSHKVSIPKVQVQTHEGGGWLSSTATFKPQWHVCGDPSDVWNVVELCDTRSGVTRTYRDQDTTRSGTTPAEYRQGKRLGTRLSPRCQNTINSINVRKHKQTSWSRRWFSWGGSHPSIPAPDFQSRVWFPVDICKKAHNYDCMHYFRTFNISCFKYWSSKWTKWG